MLKLISIPVGIAILTSCSTGNTTSSSSEPLGPVGTATLKVIESTKICVERSKELTASWSIDNAIYNWNKNGSNILTTSSEEPHCSGVVSISEVPTGKFYGNTEFFKRDVIVITLSSDTPIQYRSHVITHELGHVLGLAHSNGDGSPMDPNQFNTEPTDRDLSLVAQEKWTAGQAGRTCCAK